ncbi:MAG: hypothetical protein LC676_07025, partial [Loktanella sp.]|nr:hypothetical protein [Loktanella sp.]
IIFDTPCSACSFLEPISGQLTSEPAFCFTAIVSVLQQAQHWSLRSQRRAALSAQLPVTTPLILLFQYGRCCTLHNSPQSGWYQLAALAAFKVGATVR